MPKRHLRFLPMLRRDQLQILRERQRRSRRKLILVDLGKCGAWVDGLLAVLVARGLLYDIHASDNSYRYFCYIFVAAAKKLQLRSKLRRGP